MERGYVYVMINASYEGIVKVGKTTKSPEERAKELSSATGVPTPFIVVYKRVFQDCGQAEKIAHEILTSRGCRVNDMREFFAVDITDAINVVLSIPDELDDSLDFLNCLDDGEEDEVGLAESFYELGENAYYGLEDTFEDEDAALEYYQRSAELGYSKAYFRIGSILSEKGNKKKALNAFQCGAKLGYGYCYAKLGCIYMDSDAPAFHNERNEKLAWNKYFEFVDKVTQDEEYDRFLTFHLITDYLWKKLLEGKLIDSDFEIYFLKYSNEIKSDVNSFISDYKTEKGNEGIVHSFEKVITYLNKLENNV